MSHFVKLRRDTTEANRKRISNADDFALQVIGRLELIEEEQGRFSWFNDWGFFKILVTFVLLLATDGVWIFFVLGWKLSHIVAPPFLCQFCDSKIEKEQLRG